jgi:REP element-mobilizing transposase RayT
MKANTFYHIYNHANGFENLFLSDENYRFFLEKYFLFISPIADTYSYCLMPNHFHLLVKIKDEKEIIKLINNKNNVAPFLKFKTLNTTAPCLKFKTINNDAPFLKFRTFNTNAPCLKFRTFNTNAPCLKFKTLDKVQIDIEKYLSKQFSNLFSSYTQAFNKMYKRRGSLFIKTFKRKEVKDHSYLKNLIIYIHTNPIHHKFCNDINDWKWNSYFHILDTIHSSSVSNEVILLFDSIENFKENHIYSVNKKNNINEYIFLE